MSEDTRIERLENRRNHVRMTLEISRFRLPPVESALVIGKRASIGPNAMQKALAEMMPNAFTLVPVEHPVIEAVIVRSIHLRRVPREKLVPVILRNCDNLMDESDMMHFELDIRVLATEEVEL